MTTDLPLSANWILNVYVNDVNAIRFDDERLRAIDAAIDEHNVAIEALKAERGALRANQDERIAVLNGRLCTALHVKLDDDGCPVARQGKPRKAAEPPALVSPTPDPVLANLVGDAERGLAAMASEAPAGEASTSAEQALHEAPRRGVLGVTPERLIEAVTGHTSDGEIADASTADAFIADVSEPERSLYEQGYTAAEVAATPIEEQWRLKRANVSRADVRQTSSGTWYEPATPPPDPIENEEAPF